jgi:hypothetical protein
MDGKRDDFREMRPILVTRSPVCSHNKGDRLEEGEPIPFVLNDYEFVFDAADFVRCGLDLFGIRSKVTNESGIHWLWAHLGDRFRLPKFSPPTAGS